MRKTNEIREGRIVSMEGMEIEIADDGTMLMRVQASDAEDVATIREAAALAGLAPERQRIINDYEAAFQMRSWDTVEQMQADYPWLHHTTQAEFDEAMRVYEGES